MNIKDIMKKVEQVNKLNKELNIQRQVYVLYMHTVYGTYKELVKELKYRLEDCFLLELLNADIKIIDNFFEYDNQYFEIREVQTNE